MMLLIPSADKIPGYGLLRHGLTLSLDEPGQDQRVGKVGDNAGYY